MAKPNISAEELREVLDYRPDTGIFTWKQARTNSNWVGKPAGCQRPDGYWVINIKKKLYLAHRLAWFYVHGEWPKLHIDHINGERIDNRIENLRDVAQRTNRENLRGAKSNNKAGLLGVNQSPTSGRWFAFIKANGKNMYLGSHETAEQAHMTYLTAKRQYHEGCTI